MKRSIIMMSVAQWEKRKWVRSTISTSSFGRDFDFDDGENINMNINIKCKYNIK